MLLLLPIFSSFWQVTRVPAYVQRPFPSKENRRISERDDLVSELLDVWDGPMEV